MGESTREEPWRKYFDAKPDRLLYQDESIVVFRDRTPRATSHLLVVPRYHSLLGVEALTSAHLPLLAHMGSVAHRVAPESTEPLVLGFHQKPMRSVPYLHMHCITPPFTPPWQRIRYSQPPILGVAFVRLDTVVRKIGRLA